MTCDARRRALALLGLTALAVVPVAAGCSSGDGPAPSDVTLPSSLSVPASGPGTGPTSTTSTTTEVVPPTSPAAEGAPIIRSLVAEPGAATCAAGTIPAVVTFEVAEQPPVRVFSVFLDGAPAGSSNSSQPITVPAVACDGGVHTVLLIATGTDGQSSTQAVAFRSPRPS